MKNIVSSLYAEYGRYIDSFRAIPKDIDCLKPVERRLILSTHIEARKKLKKSAKVVGTCIGNFHPHGDVSSYDALVNLVRRGLIIGQGNWGKYGYPTNDRAAAYRYTECKAVDEFHSIFEKYLKFVPWEPLELEDEPLFIPFPVPIGLIGSGLTTGIGFHTTKIPRYNFMDLLKRLVELVDNKPLTTIKPIVNDCNVTEEDTGAFESILTKGTGRIKIEPKHNITASKIKVFGRNPICGFNRLKKINEDYEKENKIPLVDVIDLTSYDSKTSIDLEIISSKKGTFISKDIASKLINAISSKENILVNVFNAKSNRVETLGIDGLLLKGYDEWKKAIYKYYNNDLQNYKAKLSELNIIIVVRDILNQHPEILANKTIREIVKYNTSNYPNDELLRICSKHSIKTLVESHIDVKSVQNEINRLQHIVDNIDTHVLTDIKKTYNIK